MMVKQFEKLPECPHERPPRWPSGRRNCTKTDVKCGWEDPGKCPFRRVKNRAGDV
jgi:hypothetical protein